MTVPSKDFTIIADSAIDADSPITADLMDDLRNNDIHLEEWLGKNYTAVVDHNHDGVNSKVTSVGSFNTQLTANVSGTSWSITTGDVGFTNPQSILVHWALAISTAYYCGWGMGKVGTIVFLQNGMSIRFSGQAFDNISIDSNNIMGFSTSSGGSVQTSFVTEQASVTVWGGGGIVIATQSGGWGTGTLYANVSVWGT